MSASNVSPLALDGSLALQEIPAGFRDNPIIPLPSADDDVEERFQPPIDNERSEPAAMEPSDGDLLRLVPADETEDRRRTDGLDDPVRMYLKQMGPVPLLTAEQEVEICRRIEKAQNEVTQILYHLGFAAKEHLALADRLLATPPQERFDRVVSERKIECKDKHLKYIARLAGTVRDLDQQA